MFKREINVVLMVALSFAIALPSSGDIRVASALPEKARIAWTRPICVQKDRYVGWPTVARLKSGDLLVVFSGDRDEHICPYGKVQAIRSSDDGETWSSPITIADCPIDDRDAGIVQMPDGEIVVTYFTSVAYRERKKYFGEHPGYQAYDAGIPEAVRTACLGYFRVSSKDNGRTWSKPVRMVGVSHAPHGPVLLKNGALLLLGTGYADNVNGNCLGHERGKTVVSAWISHDAARTWTCLCPQLPDENGEGQLSNAFHEPHVAELPNGTLIGLVRYHGEAGDHRLRQTMSNDGGRTWSPLHGCELVGYPAHIINLSDGRLLAVYSRRLESAGFGEFATLSSNGGKTWDVDNELCLVDGFRPVTDFGYPSSCELPNHSILTVYYHPKAQGEKPCLMATKWLPGRKGRECLDTNRNDSKTIPLLPIVDISEEKFRQTIVAEGTKDRYEGHPTTLLADDGRTMFCVWTIGHGGFCGPAARSDDGGKTWTRIDSALPAVYGRTHRNCPVLQKIKGPDGKVRYFIYSSKAREGRGLGIMMSEDLGRNWVELPCQPQLASGMPPTGIQVLRDGTVALFGQVFKDSARAKDRPTDDQAVWMALSKDGGCSYGEMRVVMQMKNKNLCEPCCLRSPDGKSLLLVARENRHEGRSMMSFSSDEGKTWTVPVDTPWALTGDRHEGILLPDGRYVIAFRDRAIDSPTRGQFMAWVGTFDDLLNGRNGQCRIHLLKHHERKGGRTGGKFDTGYPGVELLPDGTIVCTTYTRHFDDDRQSSVVCTRFRIDEIDARLAGL